MRLLKRKAMICNEIMIFFRSPKPMVNNQKPYSNEDWHGKKVNHKFDKMLFSILDSEFNDKFYNQKMKLNLSFDAPLAKFTTTLRKWISNATLEAIATKLFLLDTH
jgi:hypothetical protein